MGAFYPLSIRRILSWRHRALLGISLVFIFCHNGWAADHASPITPAPIPRSQFVPAIASLSAPIHANVQIGTVVSHLVGNWLSQTMNKFESWLSNRTHMIQFCAIGMVVALFIIWWRKT
jgi:hypothetical protein